MFLSNSYKMLSFKYNLISKVYPRFLKQFFKHYTYGSTCTDPTLLCWGGTGTLATLDVDEELGVRYAPGSCFGLAP